VPFGQQGGCVAGAGAGGDRVDGDPEPPGLAGQRVHEPGQARPGQHAVATGGVVVLAAHRGHHDDPARPAFHHGEHASAAQMEHAVQAGVDDGPPVGLLQPDQRLFPGNEGLRRVGPAFFPAESLTDGLA